MMYCLHWVRELKSCVYVCHPEGDFIVFILQFFIVAVLGPSQKEGMSKHYGGTGGNFTHSVCRVTGFTYFTTHSKPDLHCMDFTLE